MGINEVINYRNSYDRVGPILRIFVFTFLVFFIGLIWGKLRFFAMAGGVVLAVFVFYTALVIKEKL